MNKINYDNRKFVSVVNTENGDVSNATVFYYRQTGNLVWAEYRGGAIIFGQLIAICDADGNLDMRYQHLNAYGNLMSGTCRSNPELLHDGRIRLYEKWQWTTGDLSQGESIVEEIT